MGGEGRYLRGVDRGRQRGKERDLQEHEGPRAGQQAEALAGRRVDAWPWVAK